MRTAPRPHKGAICAPTAGFSLRLWVVTTRTDLLQPAAPCPMRPKALPVCLRESDASPISAPRTPACEQLHRSESQYVPVPLLALVGVSAGGGGGDGAAHGANAESMRPEALGRPSRPDGALPKPPAAPVRTPLMPHTLYEGKDIIAHGCVVPQNVGGGLGEGGVESEDAARQRAEGASDTVGAKRKRIRARPESGGYICTSINMLCECMLRQTQRSKALHIPRFRAKQAAST